MSNPGEVSQKTQKAMKKQSTNETKYELDDGSPGRIRTSDQPVNSRLLYR